MGLGEAYCYNHVLRAVKARGERGVLVSVGGDPDGGCSEAGCPNRAAYRVRSPGEAAPRAGCSGGAHDWVYARALNAHFAGYAVERICGSCGLLENVEMTADIGDEFRRAWRKFHGPGAEG